MDSLPFWELKILSEMTPEEWEQLCDGCGQCCLYKFEDEDSGEILRTYVACRYMDLKFCHCTVYGERTKLMPTCVTLDPEKAGKLKWLPETCAYRLVAEGKSLPEWHWLICGDRQAVHRAGVSVRDAGIPEKGVNMDKLEDYIIEE